MHDITSKGQLQNCSSSEGQNYSCVRHCQVEKSQPRSDHITHAELCTQQDMHALPLQNTVIKAVTTVSQNTSRPQQPHNAQASKYSDLGCHNCVTEHTKTTATAQRPGINHLQTTGHSATTSTVNTNNWNQRSGINHLLTAIVCATCHPHTCATTQGW